MSATSNITQAQITLTFDRPPKDPLLGFVFGSDPNLCDVLIGSQQDRVSRRHFCITFDSERRVKLKDISRAGTIVNQDGDGAGDTRIDFAWILFWTEKAIKITAGNSETLKLRLASHTECQNNYNACVDRFSARAMSTITPMGQLVVKSHRETANKTAPGSATKGPLYGQLKRLGAGGFGVVYRATDMSTGAFYAIKRFIKASASHDGGSPTFGDFKREVDNLKKSSHVSAVYQCRRSGT